MQGDWGRDTNVWTEQANGIQAALATAGLVTVLLGWPLRHRAQGLPRQETGGAGDPHHGGQALPAVRRQARAGGFRDRIQLPAGAFGQHAPCHYWATAVSRYLYVQLLSTAWQGPWKLQGAWQGCSCERNFGQGKSTKLMYRDLKKPREQYTMCWRRRKCQVKAIWSEIVRFKVVISKLITFVNP